MKRYFQYRPPTNLFLDPLDHGINVEISYKSNEFPLSRYAGSFSIVELIVEVDQGPHECIQHWATQRIIKADEGCKEVLTFDPCYELIAVDDHGSF